MRIGIGVARRGRPKTSRQFELEALQDRTLLSVTFSDLNAASNTYTIDRDPNNPANLEVVGRNGVKLRPRVHQPTRGHHDQRNDRER